MDSWVAPYDEGPSDGPKKIARVTASCDYCIHRKIKCNAGQPCDQCTKRGRECLYTKERKPKGPGRRRTVKSNTVQELEAKVKALESIVASGVGTVATGTALADEEAMILGAMGNAFGSASSSFSLTDFSTPAPLITGNLGLGAARSNFQLAHGAPLAPAAGFMASVGGRPGDEHFWLASQASSSSALNFDPSLAMRLLQGSSVDRPLNPFNDELPDSSVMNSLFSVYRETLGNLILFSSSALRYADASPLVRLAMSALGARYLPECSHFGDALFQRVRKMLQPTLSGDVPPTIDVVQGLFNVVVYAGVSNDEGELLLSHRMLRQLTNYVKELSLEDEKKTVATRNWGGEKMNEVDLNLRRSLFWTIFCAEAHFVLMDTFRGAFRDSDVNVGLPWSDASQEWELPQQQNTLRLAQFDSGLGELASAPFARIIFLHHILRRAVDISMESHHSAITSGTFLVPAVLAQGRAWVRAKLEEWYLAEAEFAGQDAHQFGDVLVPEAVEAERDERDSDEMFNAGMFDVPLVDRNGTLIPIAGAAGGQRIFLRRLQARSSLSSKAIIFHGLSAFCGAPREDLEAFFDITNVGFEPMSKQQRQMAKERLTRWIRLPMDFAARQAADPSVVPDEAVRNVIVCYDHVAALVVNVRALLEANPSVSFVHPLTLWCIWMAGILDLARFVLTEGPTDPEMDARIPFLLQVLQHVTANHSWPFAASFIDGFARMYEWGLRFKASQVVATLTLQPTPNHMLDYGLRFFPKEGSLGDELERASARSESFGGEGKSGSAASPGGDFLPQMAGELLGSLGDGFDGEFDALLFGR